MDQFKIKKSPNNKFFRPQNKEDAKYRRIQKATFAEKLEKILPRNCTLCFHGTTIWNAEQILKSGNISAEIDRKGAGEGVLEMHGKISVSTVETLWFTVKQFSDLANFDYPAGCIFVLEPHGNEEIESSKNNLYINNVDLRAQPQRLKAIITTPENIEQVCTWVKESDLDLNSSIVFDYEAFLAETRKTHEDISQKTL